MLVRFSDEGDFVDRLDDLLDLDVMNVATRRVVTVEASDSIDDACHVLAEKRIKKVPVVQDGKLVGAVTHVLVNDPTRGYGILAENMVSQCVWEEQAQVS